MRFAVLYALPSLSSLSLREFLLKDAVVVNLRASLSSEPMVFHNHAQQLQHALPQDVRDAL
jgi:hypothetical protein